MPNEPAQIQIPTARASVFNGSLPPPGKSDTMDELMCTVRVPSGTRHVSYADSTRSPGPAASRTAYSYISQIRCQVGSMEKIVVNGVLIFFLILILILVIILILILVLFSLVCASP